MSDQLATIPPPGKKYSRANKFLQGQKSWEAESPLVPADKES